MGSSHWKSFVDFVLLLNFQTLCNNESYKHVKVVERQIDRKTERQKDRKTERRKDRKSEIQNEGESERRSDIKTEREIERLIKIQDDRKAENLLREASLVRMNDIINGDFKMNCNKYSHQRYYFI